MRMYKKLGLSWRTEENIEGSIVDGWFNKDKSQFIIKLVEEGDYKRLKFHGCDGIYDYFISLGAIPFDKDTISSTGKVVDIDEYRFIGADLWSHHRTEQLLKDMPVDWGVKWK